MGTKAIARRLTKMRIPTWKDIHKCGFKRRGYGEWGDGAVSHILKNETYCGLWHYGKRKNGRPNPRSHWLAVAVPPIISRELWNKAQRQKEHNRAMAKRNEKYNYLIGRRVTCGMCGHKTHDRSSNGGKATGTYLYYNCTAKDGDSGPGLRYAEFQS